MNSVATCFIYKFRFRARVSHENGREWSDVAVAAFHCAPLTQQLLKANKINTCKPLSRHGRRRGRCQIDEGTVASRGSGTCTGIGTGMGTGMGTGTGCSNNSGASGQVGVRRRRLAHGMDLLARQRIRAFEA
jgi:hypothetical protein